VRGWTNDEAIRRWAQFPREVLDAMAPDGDFSKRHLLNPALLRMMGEVRGRRILDAGFRVLRQPPVLRAAGPLVA